MKKPALSVILAFIAGFALSGCLRDSNVPGSPASSSSTPPSSTGNAAPVISGSPTGSVVAGQSYRFAPTASDPNGDRLTFGVSNAPAWTSFDPTTGVLSGTPTASPVGGYANVRVTVSDGRMSASTSAFTITVTSVGMGAATLSWQPPTQNEDGTPLSGLAGYRIQYGTNQNALDRVVDISNPGITRYVVDNLSQGTYYFGVRAVGANGVESNLSGIVSKTIS